MQRTTRLGLIGIAAATAVLLAGCEEGAAIGGPDEETGIPDGVAADLPDADAPEDTPRTDVRMDAQDVSADLPTDAPADAAADGTVDVPADVPVDVPVDGRNDAPDEAIDAPDLPVDIPEATEVPVPGDAPDEGTTDLAADADADAPDVQPPCDATQAVAKGKDWLEKAEPGFARNAFEEALAACPDDTNARFGAALTEMIYGSELFVSALTVATGQGTGPKQAAFRALDTGEDASQNEILAAQLHSVMMALRSHFAKALEHLEALGDRDIDFRVVGVGVYLGIHPNLVLHGRFDKGDVLLMRAVGSLITGILDVLAGQDFNTDVLSVVSLARNGLKSKVDFIWISRFVAYLLNEDARFLAIHPQDGAMLFADARKRLSDVGPLLDAALAEIRRQGAGDDHVSFVEDAAAGTVLNVQSRVRLDDDGETPFEEPWYLILSDTTLQAFRDASRSILTPGGPVTLHGAVLPVLSTVLVGFVRVDLLDILGIEMPGGLDLAALEADELLGVLTALMPNVMAFDWGTFFSTPVGLRAWLPAVTSDRPLMQNTILASWECPDDLATDGFPSGALRMLCKEGVLVDGPHFPDTPFATQADGILSPFPVLAFPDPTLHGLAYVDLAGTDGNRDASTYSRATGTTLNAALASLLADILKLLD